MKIASLFNWATYYVVAGVKMIAKSGHGNSAFCHTVSLFRMAHS